MKIGVLAGQDYFQEHIRAIQECGLMPVEIKTPEDLDKELEGLIIAGKKSADYTELLNDSELLIKI